MARRVSARRVLIAAGAVVLVLLFLARREWRPFDIPATSMEPALELGDHFLARRYGFVELERGDVAVLVYRPGIDYVRRLIGFPGELIQLRGGTLYINDVAVKRERIGGYVNARGRQRDLYRETLPNGVSYPIILDPADPRAPEKPCDALNQDSGDPENTCPFVVPPDQYFVLGDNRDHSADSRDGDLGFVARDRVVARVGLIWWSRSWSRIGKTVE